MGGPLSRRSLCLFWCETKQRPEFEIFDEAGQGNTSQSNWKKEPREGSWRRAAEETSRHEIESRSNEGRPVKMSQHSSWLCGNFAKDACQR